MQDVVWWVCIRQDLCPSGLDLVLLGGIGYDVVWHDHREGADRWCGVGVFR